MHPEVDPPPKLLAAFADSIEVLRDTGRLFYQRGWSLGTSSNYSVVVRDEPRELLITASGMDKGRLRPEDFVLVAADGCPTADNQPKSSAETLLHCVAAEQPGVGAVLHTHSVWCTVLSDLFFDQRGFEISGYEMLKGLAGITTHDHSKWIEIFSNTQDIPLLADQVRKRLNDPDQPLAHGYIIHRHGLYTWGHDLWEARRHVEIFEFLFECIGRRLMLQPPPGPAQNH